MEETLAAIQKIIVGKAYAEMESRMTPLLFFFHLLFLLFLCSSKPHPCSAAAAAAAVDTMYAGQSLSGNLTLVSKGGVFELGFFSPGKSHNYYIGIWHRERSSVTNFATVWVANRDTPLADLSSSEFKLLQNGNLVLFKTSSKIPIWSTNSTSKTSNSSKVVLGDDGNLVLKGGSDSFSEILWQSFDHSTNTYLPGSKMGYINHRTNERLKLTSWRNSEDPSQGIFSSQVFADGHIGLVWNGSQEYATTGTWNGNNFGNIPKLPLNYLVNFTRVSNENESYFTFIFYNKSLLSKDVLDLSGQVKSFIRLDRNQEWSLFWCQPQKKCDVYGLCGNFGICTENGSPTCRCLPGFEERSPHDWDLLDYSGGCVRRTPLQCGEKDKFLKMPNIKMPMNKQNLADVRSVDECKSACLRNCSCSAYTYTGSCSVWYHTMLNSEQLGTGGDDMFIRVAASEVLNFSSTKKTKKISAVWIVVGAVSGITVLFAAITLVLIICKGKRNKISIINGTTPRAILDDEGTRGPMFNQYAFLTAFQYKDLKIATKNFSEKLGGGSFGFVFKGTLPDSTLIAVKKLESFSQGEKQFRSEVSTIGLIQHVNLVRLRGFCSKGTKRILVYDFMPNGSLDSHLFHQNNLKILHWKTRYQIAVGTAKGLAYLHEGCRDCIIHCDIKPENILLDADFCPKVADFGLAKLVGREFSRVLTTIRGTIGYLAPEWTSGTAITAKADVYSYGMMLFEIISGRRNMKQSNDEKVCFFPTWATSKLAEGKDVISMVDNKLGGNADVEEVTRAFRVAGWCIQEEEALRPTMGQVVQILDGLLEMTPPPVPTYLQAFVGNEGTVNFFSETST